MLTKYATLVLASLQRSPRMFQSFDLSKVARQRIDAVQLLLTEYRHRLADFDPAGALVRIERAYAELGAAPPPATPADVDGSAHPMMVAVATDDHAAETEAWRVFLSSLSDQRV
jgi:hypothetical protein